MSKRSGYSMSGKVMGEHERLPVAITLPDGSVLEEELNPETVLMVLMFLDSVRDYPNSLLDDIGIPHTDDECITAGFLGQDRWDSVHKHLTQAARELVDQATTGELSHRLRSTIMRLTGVAYLIAFRSYIQEREGAAGAFRLRRFHGLLEAYIAGRPPR